MGILQRFGDIMKSNINALLDKCEDPEKMIDQTLRDLQEDLAEVKKETASVMADEKRCQRVYDEHQAEVTKWTGLAEKALVAGNEEDARKFLAKKQAEEANLASVQTALQAAQTNSNKMRQLHDKLTKDIEELDSRRDSIKAKIAVAKTQQKVNDIVGGIDSTASISAFERMEVKANKMLDEANAMTDLNTNQEGSVEALADKYDAAPDANVDAELAAMKAKLGLS